MNVKWNQDPPKQDELPGLPPLSTEESNEEELPETPPRTEEPNPDVLPELPPR